METYTLSIRETGGKARRDEFLSKKEV
ncbi:hypothetical protein LCGC14_3023210, partial [marine sediment metagenome]